MKFYQPGRHQAATQIGAYFALLETIRRYQNEGIEPLGGAQRSRRVALQVFGMGQNVGQAVDPHFDPHHFRRFCNKKAPKTEVFDAFWSCWADSNRRPHPYQGCALPTELQQHNVATKKGLEPSTSSVTGWRSNQLNYLAICAFVLELKLAYYSKNVPECQHPFYIFRKRWRGDFLHT